MQCLDLTNLESDNVLGLVDLVCTHVKTLLKEIGHDRYEVNPRGAMATGLQLMPFT